MKYSILSAIMFIGFVSMATIQISKGNPIANPDPEPKFCANVLLSTGKELPADEKLRHEVILSEYKAHRWAFGYSDHVNQSENKAKDDFDEVVNSSIDVKDYPKAPEYTWAYDEEIADVVDEYLVSRLVDEIGNEYSLMQFSRCPSGLAYKMALSEKADCPIHAGELLLARGCSRKTEAYFVINQKTNEVFMKVSPEVGYVPLDDWISLYKETSEEG